MWLVPFAFFPDGCKTKTQSRVARCTRNPPREKVRNHPFANAAREKRRKTKRNKSAVVYKCDDEREKRFRSFFFSLVCVVAGTALKYKKFQE